MNDFKNQELSPEEKIKSDALRLLSVRPRSIEELRSRLKLKKHADGAIDSVIELLKKQGLLDDEKFAKVFTGAKTFSRPMARRQIERDLKKKGVSSRIIENALSSLAQYDEKEAARKAVEKRFLRMTDIAPEKKKTRLFGFLKRRGFSNETIFSVLSDLVREEDFSRGSESDEG